MKILITGGAGYIGSELVNFLLKRGHSVVVADSLDYEPTSLLRYSFDDRFEFVKLDIRRKDLLKDLIAKCDVIIPLACLVGFPLCEEKPIEAVEVNYEIINGLQKINLLIK